MMEESVALLQELRFEIVSYFDHLVDTAILHCEAMLNDRYLLRTYIERPEEGLSKTGLAIRKKYGQLVHLLDEFKAIRKTHQAA
jgi:hypothetical protein